MNYTETFSDSDCYDFKADFSDEVFPGSNSCFFTVGSGCFYVVSQDFEGLFSQSDNYKDSNDSGNADGNGFTHEDIDNFFD